MSDQFINESMLDVYVFETTQLIEKLEDCTIFSESSKQYSDEMINEIFRIMHTIKGSSSMMQFNNLTALAHSLEDVFYLFRENDGCCADISLLSDYILEFIDFVHRELDKLQEGSFPDGNAQELTESIQGYLQRLKERNTTEIISQGYSCYRIQIHFVDGCEMENIRAYSVIYKLKNLAEDIVYYPKDIIENEESSCIIRKDGFSILLKTSCNDTELEHFFEETIFLKEFELSKIMESEWQDIIEELTKKQPDYAAAAQEQRIEDTAVVEKSSQKEMLQTKPQNIISVNVSKVDVLMDLVGEMLIAQDMVLQNPELKNLELDGFHKSARQLRKITNDIQNLVMSIRMVPLSATFHKMHRIVRDMCKTLNKDAELIVVGEEIEADKKVIEYISDPIMHLIRNALDHGIEQAAVRRSKGKRETGRVILEARNEGSDVLIIVRDDGEGLDRHKIYEKALKQGLVSAEREELTEKEIYNLILEPGFSTNEEVTQYSGRGVGMDVVRKNLEIIGGNISIESRIDKGTEFIMKIPLTLAIIDGMIIRIGEAFFTIPTVSIRESMQPEKKDIIVDPDGNEMLMVRGNCYPIIRLHRLYSLYSEVMDFTKGIMIIVEHEEKFLGLFADELVGQQQVVVKSLPVYIQRLKRVKGLAGCTLLGEGHISLLLDINSLVNE